MELPFAALHQLCAPLLDRLDGLPGPQRDALATTFGLSAGVVPDEIALPSAADVAQGFDPVLSRAVESLGGSMTPQQAGRLFPIEWANE